MSILNLHKVCLDILLLLGIIIIIINCLDIIPIRFGADGVANNFGTNYILLFIPV
jgi:hypothetical protein